ncbi:hypothetical protein LUZ62_039451 [Rhynchospora pubera]|uniref:RRM domain-containing protein n=1 Tax=Rhynchospora pubera TaxID=906938 RepID=A0AAV8F9A2_9POAL|nr:hypothetical protein LUZ62_039451 [Rhynchospora pubera]
MRFPLQACFVSTRDQSESNCSPLLRKEGEREGKREADLNPINPTMNGGQVQKNTLYVGGLAEEVDEKILHAAFVPFGDIKDVKTPLDQATQKHRSFGFVTFLEREDAAAAMDNMDGSELYGRVLTVNYAFPEKIKGGEQGWAAQPIWADADTWFERQQHEEEMRRLEAEQKAAMQEAERIHFQKMATEREGEKEDDTSAADPMAMAEAEALNQKAS